MNNLEQQLASILTDLVANVSQAKEFVLNQLPDVIVHLLTTRILEAR